MPVIKVGLVQFLSYTFICNNVGKVTPIELLEKLKKHQNVGTSIFGRRTANPPDHCLLLG